MKKVCVVTGTRAEYGLLYWTMKAISADRQLILQVCATGMHLSPEFGLTYKHIEKDGFKIDAQVEMLLSSDTPIGLSKSVGLGVIGFADAFALLKPDLILVLGDRFEIFAAATAAMICKIPIAHCHGGEATEGLIDEAIRHSITKMSHIHFAAAEQYRNRIIQLGESPETVFNVGALGIENINKLNLLPRQAFEESINFKLGQLNFLVTFHPVSLETSTAEEQFNYLLSALDKFPDAKVLFTKPNADTDGRVIISLIDEYVKRNEHRAISFITMGQLRYVSALQHVDLVIGNSSSGLVEVPSFKKPTLNIGDRQRGRLKAVSVVDCLPTIADIETKIKYVLSEEFQKKLIGIENPYGTGNASEKILKVIKNTSLHGIIKKKFFNIEIK
jgi:GDP/UDP-N,N'-diacetylbacillosamine 2-epimerase (hydrolysing)